MPVLGHQDNELNVDWDVNAAVLFGRQCVKVQHQTTGSYHPTPVDASRFRSVIIPNVGGFAGLSFRYTNAKISLGYRADFFFGAMDNGNDQRLSVDNGFYGPYATISTGLAG